MKIKKKLLALLLGSSAFLLAGTLGAQELPVEEAAEVVEAVAEAIPFEDGYAAFMETPGAAFFTISNLWLLLSAALVFIMHLGFATVESGLSQSKNTVNILFKNVFIISMGLLTYALWGFNAMYPGDAWSIGGFFAMGSWFDVDASLDLMTSEYADYTWYTDFIFLGHVCCDCCDHRVWCGC